MRYGLLGEHLPHSFSRQIHEALGRYAYELIEVAPADLDTFMTARDFAAINVTIPYKQAVLPYLKDLTPRARAIGAVNAIVNRGGELYGDNTDFGGLEALIRRMGLDLAGKTVLILGTGGTSLTAQAVARDLGAGEVYRLSRSGRDGALTYDRAVREHPAAEIILNTTPSGMYPDLDAQPLDLSAFRNLRGLVDVIYNPLTTRLVQQARDRGVPAENGLYMLVAQAVLAAEFFLGETMDPGKIDEIYHSLRFDHQNLVLVGMPGSGKTTLGQLLAARLSRPLVDTDREIVARTGMEITDIFAAYGEGRFRDLETQVIREVSRTGGKLIATGGGAVLRTENVAALKQNGVVVFLDRALSELLPTADRPLANSAEKIRALYGARRPKYLASADVTLPVEGTPADTADALVRCLS